MNTTATVETLTAEVRTLMVGSRQITLSVAKQLDVVKLSAIEPFGRVRITKDQRTVIGRKTRDGSLAVATFVAHRWLTWVLDLPGKPTVCDSALVPTGRRVDLTLDGRRFSMNPDDIEGCGNRCWAHGRSDCPVREGWSPNDLEPDIWAALTADDEHYAIHQAAQRLPLIVLAGLK